MESVLHLPTNGTDPRFLLLCLDRLPLLFNVNSAVLPTAKPSNNHITASDSFAIKLWIDEECPDKLRLATEYVMQTLSGCPRAVERRLSLNEFPPLSAFQLAQIERDTCVVLQQQQPMSPQQAPGGTVGDANVAQLVLTGAPERVAFALRRLQQEGSAPGGMRQSTTADSLLSEPLGATAGGPQLRKLESEDSSYDSDTDLATALPTRCRSPPSQHEDVCRTVSDTLGAEFAEYVTTHQPIGSKGNGPIPLNVVQSDPTYTARVEFGLKLGYTVHQVATALQRLGVEATQNELLNELIKLGSESAAADQSSCGADRCIGGQTMSKSQMSFGAALNTSTSSGVVDPADSLRHIVVDGSNVAMSHGNKEVFSCRGILICVEWFRARGHRHITVFVPSWRKEASKPQTPIADREILLQLEKERVVVFTPSRNVGGKRMSCYEDRYVLNMAQKEDGVVVSNDTYRDLVQENPEFKRIVEERLLMYSFAGDHFMPPDDPLGRRGPTLDQFLRKPTPALPETLPQPCPYAKKCTYGNKCKFYHPERGNQPQKSVTEKLAEQARLQLQEVKSSRTTMRDTSPGETPSLRTKSMPLMMHEAGLVPSGNGGRRRQPLSRTKSAAPPGTGNVVVTTAENLYSGHGSSLATSSSSQSSFVKNLHSSWSSLPATTLDSDQGHLALAKRLSDPDSNAPSGGSSPGVGTSAAGSTANLHRKLARQLTLNPHCNDPRLQRMRSETSPQHNSVTRISSAPDATRGAAGAIGGMLPSPAMPQAASLQRMQRLSSTSDTRLNLYPSATGPHAAFMQPHMFPPQQFWGAIPQGMYRPLRPSSVPPPRGATPTHLAVAPGPLDHGLPPDPRSKLYYHLTNIFPEYQVRQAMDMYPDETNAQAICSAILTMFPATKS